MQRDARRYRGGRTGGCRQKPARFRAGGARRRLRRGRPGQRRARGRRLRSQAFGNVHVVCNNAGVAGGSGIDDISLDNWRWVLDVNLMGVLHGIRSFLPHIRAHGEGGHIVNTASMAGMQSGLGFSPYSASKFAVVNMSEGLAAHLKPLGIGVTVLCPGFVRTRIGDSGRNRPERYGPALAPDPASPAGAMAAEIAQAPRRRDRSGGCRRAGSRRDPRGRTLRVHASRNARRGGRAVRGDPGGVGQGGEAVAKSWDAAWSWRPPPLRAAARETEGAPFVAHFVRATSPARGGRGCRRRRAAARRHTRSWAAI